MTTSRHWTRGLAVAALALGLGWTAPAMADAALDGFVKKLDQMVRQAERDRAASPDFLNDLKKLLAESRRAQARAEQRRDQRPAQAREQAGGQGGGKMERLVASDFRDWDQAMAAGWRNPGNRWRHEPLHGARAVAEDGAAPAAAAAASEPAQPAANPSVEALLAEILRELREEEGGGQASGGAATAAASDDAGAEKTKAPPAVLMLREPVPNAFRMTVDLRDHGGEGRMIIGAFQQANNKPIGYRIMLRSGKRPGLILMRLGATTTKTLAEADYDFARNKPRKLEIIRSPNGRTRVRLDGEVVMDLTAKAFLDPWDGVFIRAMGGDFSVENVVISGRKG